MIHISSHITLYERVMYSTLKEALGTSDKQMIREVFRLPADAIRIYGSFAQQLARIIKLLYDEEAVLARCWLTMYATTPPINTKNHTTRPRPIDANANLV
jgi:hypothetical protein